MHTADLLGLWGPGDDIRPPSFPESCPMDKAQQWGSLGCRIHREEHGGSERSICFQGVSEPRVDWGAVGGWLESAKARQGPLQEGDRPGEENNPRRKDRSQSCGRCQHHPVERSETWGPGGLSLTHDKTPESFTVWAFD